MTEDDFIDLDDLTPIILDASYQIHYKVRVQIVKKLCHRVSLSSGTLSWHIELLEPPQ